MGTQKRIEFSAPARRVVAKANDLVRARHSFSTVEQRIFVMMVAQLEKGMEEFPMQEVPVRDVCDVSDVDPSNLYRRIDEITDRLLEQFVEVRIEDEDGRETGFRKYSCFTVCEYDRGSGAVRAKFSSEMRPFLLKLKERFTLYLVTVFLRLRSKYSTQIYELLKMRQQLRRHRMSVDEFRHSLGLEDKYERFSSLKKRVIEQARKELKEKADIYFTYNVIRDGRTPKKIEFYIHENEPVVQQLKQEFPNAEQGSGPAVGRADGNAEGNKAGSSSNSDVARKADIDPKAMFLSDRTQEELQSISRDELDELHERARSAAEESNPNTESNVLIKQQTYSRMNRIWENR